MRHPCPALRMISGGSPSRPKRLGQPRWRYERLVGRPPADCTLTTVGVLRVPVVAALLVQAPVLCGRYFQIGSGVTRSGTVWRWRRRSKNRAFSR